MSYPDIKPNINIKPDPAGSAGPSRLPFTSMAGPSTGQPLGKQEDEELTLSIPAQGGAGWAVRVPTFLYEKWSMVQKEGVHLGTLQVDSSYVYLCLNAIEDLMQPYKGCNRSRNYSVGVGRRSKGWQDADKQYDPRQDPPHHPQINRLYQLQYQ